jgi:hypothetical protein
MYAIVCLVLLGIAVLIFTSQKKNLSTLIFLYGFDRKHLFLYIYFGFLFILGLLLRISNSPNINWSHAILIGALNGIISGILASFAVIFYYDASRKIFNFFQNNVSSSFFISQVSFTLLTVAIIFSTPIWGVLSACIAKSINGWSETRQSRITGFLFLLAFFLYYSISLLLYYYY